MPSHFFVNKGLSPIRRTAAYLNRGKLIFKDRVRIVTINYSPIKQHENHEGARQFVFWYLPQIQYKNPDVQIVLFRNMTPTPFIRTWLDTEEEVLMDIDGKNKDEILSHLTKILGKSSKTLRQEALQKTSGTTEVLPGKNCICEVQGQVPCPAVVPLPKHMRGKYRNNPDNE